MLATKPQLKYIDEITKTLSLIGFDVRFTGTTKKEASDFINRFCNYSKDVSRLIQGKPPYWSMIANQPPRHVGLHEFMTHQYNIMIEPVEQFRPMPDFDKDYYWWGNE